MKEQIAAVYQAIHRTPPHRAVFWLVSYVLFAVGWIVGKAASLLYWAIAALVAGLKAGWR